MPFILQEGTNSHSPSVRPRTTTFSCREPACTSAQVLSFVNGRKLSGERTRIAPLLNYVTLVCSCVAVGWVWGAAVCVSGGDRDDGAAGAPAGSSPRRPTALELSPLISTPPRLRNSVLLSPQQHDSVGGAGHCEQPGTPRGLAQQAQGGAERHKPHKARPVRNPPSATAVVAAAPACLTPITDGYASSLAGESLDRHIQVTPTRLR